MIRKPLTLSGGAQPKNIFWQVAGEMDGRAFAQSLIALDNNAITAP